MRQLLALYGVCAAAALLGAIPEARASSAPTLPRNAQVMDQSAFALGTMTWNVIFPQSDGSIANPDLWTAGEIQIIRSEISQAKSYWEGLTAAFNPGCRLSINVNYVNGGNPLAVPFDPSADKNETWLNAVMGQLGPYNSSDRQTNVRNFNHEQRLAAGTDWVTTIFAVHNTTFNRTSYAYSYYGGPYAMLENNSAGWGPQNFNVVLAHEMGHIFFAPDEYYGSGSTTANSFGYLNQTNLNAERNPDGTQRTPPYPNALMLNAGNDGVPFAPSPYSSDTFGFRDSDGDAIPDILDTLPSLWGSNAGSNPALGRFVFNGGVEVTELFNQEAINVGVTNSRRPMTIDTMAGAYYRLDDGSPIPLSAADGVWDGYTEDLSFTVSGLAPGQHVVDVFGVNNVGNWSNTLHFNFSAVPEPSTAAMLSFAGLASVLWRQWRKRARAT